MLNPLAVMTNPAHYAKRLRHYLTVNRHGKHVNFESLFKMVFGLPRAEMESLYLELKHSSLRFDLTDRLEKSGMPVGEVDYWFTKDWWVTALYCVVRLRKPSIVVETGVFSGISSSFILKAVHDNKIGHLYSIDLPAIADEPGIIPGGMNQELPDGLEPGFAIPDALRERWTLITGSSTEKLPSLLKDLRLIDIFLHDSDHSREHMMWEYTTAWPHITSGGLLVSDDAGMNTAMLDFCRANKVRYFEFNRKFGLTLKP